MVGDVCTTSFIKLCVRCEGVCVCMCEGVFHSLRFNDMVYITIRQLTIMLFPIYIICITIIMQSLITTYHPYTSQYLPSAM